MSFAVHRRPSWAIPDSEATPYSAFVNRRAILAGLGLGAVGFGTGLPRLALAQEADPTADL